MKNKLRTRGIAVAWILVSFTYCGDAPTKTSGARPLDLTQENAQTRYAIALAINEAVFTECRAKGAVCSAGPITLQIKAAGEFVEIFAEFRKRLRDNLTNPVVTPDMRVHPNIRIPVQVTETLRCPAGKFKTCAYTCIDVPGVWEPGTDPDEPNPGKSITVCECSCFCTFIDVPASIGQMCNAN